MVFVAGSVHGLEVAAALEAAEVTRPLLCEHRSVDTTPICDQPQGAAPFVGQLRLRPGGIGKEKPHLGGA